MACVFLILVPYHQLLQSTQDVLARTAKSCPNCGTATTHYRNHGCHHIKPGTGTDFLPSTDNQRPSQAYVLRPQSSIIRHRAHIHRLPVVWAPLVLPLLLRQRAHLDGACVEKANTPAHVGFEPNEPFNQTPLTPTQQGCANQCRLYCDNECSCPRCPDCLPGLPCAACDRDCDSCRLHA